MFIHLCSYPPHLTDEHEGLSPHFYCAPFTLLWHSYDWIQLPDICAYFKSHLFWYRLCLICTILSILHFLKLFFPVKFQEKWRKAEFPGFLGHGQTKRFSFQTKKFSFLVPRKIQNLLQKAEMLCEKMLFCWKPSFLSKNTLDWKFSICSRLSTAILGCPSPSSPVWFWEQRVSSLLNKSWGEEVKWWGK